MRYSAVGEEKLAWIASRVEDYRCCKYCLAFHLKSELWKHATKCPFRKTDDTDVSARNEMVRSGRFLLLGAQKFEGESSLDPEYGRLILASLMDDLVGKVARADQAIVRLGSILFSKLGHERACDLRHRMGFWLDLKWN